MLEIDLELSDTLRDLESAKFDQVPFATATAVNRIAKQAAANTTDRVFDEFDVKQAGRLRRSVALTQGATKLRIEATVTVRDPFLAQHEEGGIRTPGDVSSSLVRPVREREKKLDRIRGKSSPSGLGITPDTPVAGEGRIPVVHRKGAAAAKRSGNRAFLSRMASGKVGVFVRRGKKRLPIELVYSYEKKANLGRGRLKFGYTTELTAVLQWEREFGRALAEAIRTAR